MKALMKSYNRLKVFFITIFKRTNNYLESRSRLRTFVVFSFFFLVFFWAYFYVSTVSSSDDQFFHFRFAQQMLQNGVLNSFWHFKAIYFTNNAIDHSWFIYYNFLFYIVLIPFTFIVPLFLGMKLFAVLSAAFVFTTLYWCAKRFGVRYPFAGTMVVFAIISSFSIWRFFLSRPYTVAPALMLILLYFLYRRWYTAQFVLSFLYLYWHCSTFFFPLIVVVSYFLFSAIYGEKIDWKSIFAVFGGVAAAIGFSYVISPGFLTFVKDTEIGIYWETIIGKKVPLPEGGELYPVDFFSFLQQNTLLVSGMLIGVVVEIKKYFIFRKKKQNREVPAESVSADSKQLAVLRATLFFLSIGFFLGVIVVSMRFADFFVFFAGFYLIMAFGAILADIKISTDYIRKSIVVGLCVVICYLFISNILLLQTQFALGGIAPDMMEQTGEWLAAHTQKGDVVFNASWNWFPQLYYWSPNNNYVIGLEPRFLYVYNPQLYWEWWHMTTDGYICTTQNCPTQDAAQKTGYTNAGIKGWEKTEGDLVAKTILTDFHSKYIVTAQGLYQRFGILLANNSHFKLVLTDTHGYQIYQVLP